MSPRRTRAATAEQSAVSRAKARRISNVTQDMDKSAQKIRQSQKKKSVKNNLKATAKQSCRKESPNAEVTIKKSMKKKTSRRKLNLNKEEEAEAVDQTIDLNESVRILRGRNNDNVSTMGFVKHNLLQLSASKNLDSEKMPNGKLQRKTTSKLSPIIVTPKNTPPKLSLTPHRSNKTPKKSPISLDSPKTHSIAVPKLFKSPRKLSLTSTDKNSEENREKKSDSDSHAKKSQKKDSPSNNSPSDKNASGSPPRKNKHNSKVFVPKFSKSPKIVLKSPKSSKSKSRKLKSPLSPVQKRKNMLKTSPTNSPTTSNLNSDNSSRIRIQISPLFKGKNLSSIKHCLLNSKLTKTLTASQIEDVLAEPIVLLEKLSPKSLKQRSMVRSSSIRARNNSKMLTPTKKASVGMSSKRNSNPKLRNNSMEKLHVSNTNSITPRNKYNISIEEKDKSSTPLMSSTPREERMTLVDTSLTSNTSIASVNNTSVNIRLRHRNQSNMQLFNIMSNNTDIENVSKASLFDKEINGTSPSRFSHVTKQDTTYEKDNTMEKKQENNRNNTYDLEQPQILNARQMIKKHISTDVNLSLRDSAKKTKVRFANVISSRDTQKSINKLNGSRSSISRNVNAQNRNNIMNSAHKSKKVQTSKSIRSSINSPFKRSSPRFHGDTPRVHLNRIQITPKTFTSVEKKSEKKSSTIKVPNFERIHQQMFAKAESLVDVKKRLQARHLAFTTNKVDSKANAKTEEKKPLPTETRDGVHNRFGFKLKKTEATHIILKKQAVFSREKQQHEMRMTLKGIRTNRRFELLMKSRNLKS